MAHFGIRSSLLALVILVTWLWNPWAASAADAWSPAGPPAGSVFPVLIHPANPNLILAGTWKGLWRSADGGASWAFVSQVPVNWVVELAVHPAQPDRIFVAGQFGVYRSPDRGQTWAALDLAGLGGSGVVEDLKIDPSNPSTLYLASRSKGIAKSSDGGASWVWMNEGLTADRALQVYAIAIDPVSPSNVFIATGSHPHKSTNGGATWVMTKTGLSNILPYHFAIAVSPSDPSRVYVGIHGGGVARSVDGGNSWEVVTSGLPQFGCDAISVDPTNSSKVIIGNQAGVFRTTNGGTNWASASSGLPTGYIQGLARDPSNPARVFAGSTAGLFRSTNEGTQWTALNLRAGQVNHLVSSGGANSVMYAAIQDRGVFRSTNGGNTWTEANGELLKDRTVFATNRNVQVMAVRSGQPAHVFLGIRGGGVYRSTDSGATWAGANTGLTNKQITAILPHPSDDSVVLAGTSSGGVFRSVDGGDIWAASNQGLGNLTIYDLAADPGPPAILYAVTGSGVFRSADGGTEWTATGTIPPYGSGVSRILVGQGVPGTLYAAGSIGLVRSRDGGQSWKQVGPEPDEYGREQVYAVALDPQRPSTLYAVGTSGRIFRSHDRGETWQPAGPAAPGFAVNALLADPRQPNRLWIAQDGGNLGFLTQQERLSLWFPYYRAGTDHMTGFAVSNYSDQVADLTLTAYRNTGEPTTQPGNPASRPLVPRSQLAENGHELFAADPAVPLQGWVKLASSHPDIGSFFLSVGNGTMAGLMDGAVAVSGPSRRICFTRAHEGPSAWRGSEAATFLSIVNASAAATNVRLRIWRDAWTLYTTNHLLPAHGSLYGSLSELFGRNVDVTNAYVTADADEGGLLAGFQAIQLKEQNTVFGLNATSSMEAQVMFSAQLASISGFFTNIKIVNTSWDLRTVTLTAIGNDGFVLADPVIWEVDGYASLERDAAQVFRFAPDSSPVGSLRVEADGPGVIGDVVFGDADLHRYAAALPLQSEAFNSAVFSQVANGFGLFTGLAFYNPGESGVAVTVEVYSLSGELTGTAQISLAAGVRRSELLSEMFPGNAAIASQVRGYILVRSTGPVIAQQLFGLVSQGGVTLMSAVPPSMID